MKQLIEDKNIDTSSIYFTNINDSKVFVSDFRGKMIIIMGGAQKASKESEKWGKALKAACDNSIVFINVAFITKKPPVNIMPMIKNQLKKGFGKVPFLIDWGNSSDIINIANEDLTHIFLIDRQGNLRIKYMENYSDDCLLELIEAINKYV